MVESVTDDMEEDVVYRIADNDVIVLVQAHHTFNLNLAYMPLRLLEPSYNSKARHEVNFVPAFLKTLDGDLKQQLVYQGSPKDALSDLSLEIGLAIPFAPNQDPQEFFNKYNSVRSYIIIHQNEVIAYCTGIRVDIWIRDLIPISHTS
ncbi:uncharacterized protein TNCV_2719981 [Trichonephila clavipes]|nr:uncharacterized protein TNCV_2719981 [Trichonephila clavipes]